MAEARMLKRKISVDVRWADLANDTHRVLFTVGIAHLDIEGRISGEPREFKAAVVPLLEHITKEMVLDFFEDAGKLGLIRRYQVADRWIIQYPGFKKNQTLRADREGKSQYPPPPAGHGPEIETAGSEELPDYSGITPGELPEDSGTTPAKRKLNESKLTKNTPPPPPKRGAACVDKGRGTRKGSETPYSPDFDKFWSTYPNRKGGKEKAWQLWCKKMKEGVLPPAHELFTAVEALKRSQGWQKDNGDYIPMITTFLNQPRLCRSLAHGGQKLVLGTSLPEFNPSNGSLLEAKFSHRGHDSANLGEKSIFPRFRAYQSFGDQMLTGWEAYEPQASTAR